MLSVSGSSTLPSTASTRHVISVNLHAPLYIKCTATGYPKPALTWSPDRPNSRPMRSEIETVDMKHVYVVSATLQIVNVTMDINNQVFRCDARAGFLDATNLTVKLIVCKLAASDG